jgi:hypothetical protein
MFTAINMSRTVSARIPKELHEQLRERCNNVGCSINDFIEAAIEFALYGSVEFDFGDEEDDSEEESKTEVTREIPTAKPTKVSYDGKTWIDLTKKDEKPTVTIYLDK